ncbi:hypothetical protein CY34DRAFT_800686 [Suillus luteus UH-Slu-Lm8-n1]|uniref:Uncharacterized protein n=1 Tax=Suillus luteus UH-Slu-Lm8-n1 TaxID=930992 RepID=A0A0D0BJQ6_9AGAM|nr:hypothetical protein CY34DRAFT_800686 [Suillus luteus UH-Slu-Lm8-n1]
MSTLWASAVVSLFLFLAAILEDIRHLYDISHLFTRATSCLFHEILAGFHKASTMFSRINENEDFWMC